MKLKKTIPLLLSLALVTGLFSACGGSTSVASADGHTEVETSTSAETSTPTEATSQSSIDAEGNLVIPETDMALYPLDDGSNVLTFWYGSWENDYLSDITDMWNVQQAREFTGVQVEYSVCSRATETESVNLMYASGSYCDMINFMGNAYKGGHAAAVADDIYLDLTDYVEKYAPNYSFLINGSDEIHRDVLSDEGLLCGFFQISTSIQPSFQGVYVRGDWLDALNLDAPATFDELHDVMIAFRDHYDCSFGLSPDSSGVSGALAYGLDVTATNPNNGGGYILKDGTVECSFVSEGMYTYLSYLSQWYAEGLINPDFISGSDSDIYLESKCGVLTGMAEDIYNLPPQASDPNFTLTACVYPTLSGTESIHLGDLGSWVGNAGVALSTTCSNIELACKWLDFFYSDYGYEINNYGQENVTFVYNDDGKVEYTELLTNDPDGLTLVAARSCYTGEGAGARGWLYDWSATQIGAPEVLQETVVAWATDGAYIMPQMATLTTEETEQTSSLIGDCSTYWGEAILQFITGELELNEANWQEYVDHVYSLGLQDCLDAQQAAVDRYYAR